MEGIDDSDEGMNADARRVVELARRARTPGDADKRRIRAALAVTMGAAVAGSASSTAVAGAVKGAGVWLGTRVIVAAAVVASVGAGTYYWTRAPRRPETSANGAPVVAPVVPAPEVAAPPAAPAPDPLLAELGLLRQAQRALRDGQPRRALELAAQHAATYPGSQMTLERDALRVFAMCALGRKGEARELARQLIAANPRSPMRASLEESCAMR